MEIKEILLESLHFPFDNITSLAIYLVLGLVFGLVAVLTGVAGMFGVSKSSGASVVLSLIGVILCLIIYFVICGYQLDIIKSGITRSNDAPSIDFTRQTLNGTKLFIVQIVYYIIPVLITLVCALFFSHWLTVLIGWTILVIFSFAETMGECRLAETEDLNYALKINEAIEDMERIGTVKVISALVAIAIIASLISGIIGGIFGFINQDLGTIVSAIVGIYIIFFENRATGLLYSDIY